MVLSLLLGIVVVSILSQAEKNGFYDISLLRECASMWTWRGFSFIRHRHHSHIIIVYIMPFDFSANVCPVHSLKLKSSLPLPAVLFIVLTCVYALISFSFCLFPFYVYEFVIYSFQRGITQLSRNSVFVCMRINIRNMWKYIYYCIYDIIYILIVIHIMRVCARCLKYFTKRDKNKKKNKQRDDMYFPCDISPHSSLRKSKFFFWQMGNGSEIL